MTGAWPVIRERWGRYGPLILAFLVALGIARLLPPSGFGDRLENAYSDLWHRLADVRQPAQHVALVVIDEASLAAFPDDPLVFWTPHIGRAIQVLQDAGVSMVGLDIMLSISPEDWLNRHGGMGEGYDTPLLEGIAGGQLIQVAAALNDAQGKTRFLMPATPYLLPIPDLDFVRHVGLADLAADADGTIRRFRATPELNLPDDVDPASVPRHSLAGLLASRAMEASATPSHAAQPEGMLTAEGRIAYVGPPGTIQRLSLATLLAPNAAALPEVRALTGKVVIMGGEYLGMNDLHVTPYTTAFFGAGGLHMTGPEIQANIVETLLGERQIRPLPPLPETLYQALVLLLALILFQRLSPAFGAAVLLFGVVLHAGISYAAFKADLILSTTSVQIALAVAFLSVIAARFTGEQRERSRITRLFGRYVSDNVVEALLQSGKPPELGGIKTTLTILFADIRNFTTLSERLDPAEVVELLNHYFNKVCKVILDEGGTIDKFIGDAIMVQFGAPVAYPDHADRALRAAQQMRQLQSDVREWLQARHPDRDLPRFSIGIGLHTGEALIGTIGSDQRSEYTAIGDAVNAASRIEGMTKTLGCDILCSQETLAAASSQPKTGRRQSVRVKGKDQELELIEILPADAPGEST